MNDINLSSGTGSVVSQTALSFAGGCTLVAVVLSAISIHLQLKNYLKPQLQRMVVRIMLMVPIYAISSFISLISFEAAFVIDVIRDVYEAFVIYCFFHLLLGYLGGERSLLIMLHGRPPKTPPFPVNLFVRELDVSDPYTFLFLKRGILQYVQIKPVLAVATLVLKAIGKFDEGDLRANSGYLYVSIIYNISIFLALYCLAMFWMCLHGDLKPYRPVPKFLCIKGILFFSYWQSIFISILVAARAIPSSESVSPSQISLAITNLLTCAEMPLFAFFHLYAFSHTDYYSPELSYVARMPMWYAWKDAFGSKDVVEEAKGTLRGEGMDYREFEPSEGDIHQGVARERRIRAGLRYSKGGRSKYWLPRSVGEVRPRDVAETQSPLLRPSDGPQEGVSWKPEEDGAGYELPFGDVGGAIMEGDEELYEHSRNYIFGDYNYPCIDVSSEHARRAMWDEEERVLRNERGAWFSSIRGSKGRVALERREGPAWEGYGAVGTHPMQRESSRAASEAKVTPGREALIDYDQDRTAPAESGDVLLSWTKMDRQTVDRSHSKSHSTSSSPGPSSGSIPRSAHAKSPIRARETAKQDSRSQVRVTVREDAVDLVMPEDREDESVRKGKRTSPGTKTVSLSQPRPGGQDKGITQVKSPRSHGTEETGQEQRGRQPEVREGRGARSKLTTSPIYTLGDDENPWA